MRKLVTGIAVTTAVVGLGVAAFAAEGGSGSTDLADGPSVTTTVASTTTTTSTTTAASTDQEASDAAAGSGTERSTEGCGDGTFANHGAYVSSVAHDPEREAGDVSAAAHSECGKPLGAAGEPEETTIESTESAAPDSTHQVGIGNGHGNALHGPRH